MTRKPTKPRRASDHWRVLVHDVEPRGGSGVAHHIGHSKTYGGGDGTDSEWSRHTEIPGTDFDELVVGGAKAHWLHIEQMDTGYWWMSISGVVVHVKADRDGRPLHVMVHGPGDYEQPVEGCTYELAWSADNEPPKRRGKR
jgi:hypothetical protein